MTLRAAEDDVYRLMDRKDRYFTGAGLCGAAAGIFRYLLIRGMCWDWLYFFLVSCAAALFLMYSALKLNQRIMETDTCYIGLEPDCLVVRQAEKNYRYESCRIFYDEIEKIVEGSSPGIAEFYVVICDLDDSARKSFILLGDEEKETRVFCVKSFGYEKKGFQELYQKLRRHVPGKVQIIGTEGQDAWNMQKKHRAAWMIAAMGLVYLVPKIMALLF